MEEYELLKIVSATLLKLETVWFSENFWRINRKFWVITQLINNDIIKVLKKNL